MGLVTIHQNLDHLFLPSASLLALGLALRVSLRLLYGARGPSPDDAVHLMTRILSWGLIFVSGAILFAMMLNWISLILLAAILGAITEVTFARRAIQRHSAWYLLLASRHGNRSLGESLQFHQARFNGIVGRWYRRLAADLQRGMPWTEAVWNNRRALPREAAAYAWLYQTATPAEASAGEASERRDMGMHQLRQTAVQQLAYLAMIVAMMIAILTFANLRLLPDYESIFGDFSMASPSVTRSLGIFFNVFDSAMNLPLFLAAVSLAISFFIVVGILYLCDRPVLRPLTDRFGFARHQANVLRLLALAVSQQLPVSDALAQLAAGHGAVSSSIVRRRLAAARQRIANGVEWQTALSGSGIISQTDAAMLRAAQEVGNLPWTMRLLADRKLTLLVGRWAVTVQLLFAASLLLLALLVFWFALALFTPIVEVIWKLS